MIQVKIVEFNAETLEILDIYFAPIGTLKGRNGEWINGVSRLSILHRAAARGIMRKFSFLRAGSLRVNRKVASLIEPIWNIRTQKEVKNLSALRKTQMPKCPQQVCDPLYEVVKQNNAHGKPHHRLKCATCNTVAGNAAKPKRLVRYDADLLEARRDELRRRRAGDKTLRK